MWMTCSSAGTTIHPMPSSAWRVAIVSTSRARLASTTITPGGYKGMGECGTIGPPAAIANAVADAVRPLGIAITALPILPEALLRPRGGAAPRA